jgi:ABC-type glutathione transport system ATPase component
LPRKQVERRRVVACRHPLRHAPTYAPDVSVQGVIFKLPVAFCYRLGMSFLFISHDFDVVRSTCDRAMV